MNLDDQIELEHLLFFERKCRICGKVKSLLDDYYLTRKDRKPLPSSYSYECKECTKKRIINARKIDMPYEPVPRIKDVYPDW
tara:strand:- start:694 stop:939 length:246 start_codon:yes stop_codon:yes gene_type:complete